MFSQKFSMSSTRYTTVPEAPDHLSGESRKVWYMAGLKLVKEDRFDDDAYQRLSDLCYWEEQKLTTLERLRAVQVGPGSVSPKMTRSVALKNLKTIKAEIDQLRTELGIEQNEAAWITESQPISEDAYESLPLPIASCCALIEDPTKRDLFLLTLLPTISAHVPNAVAEHADGCYSASLNLFLIDKSGYGQTFSNRVLQLKGSSSSEDRVKLYNSVNGAVRELDESETEFWRKSHALYESDFQVAGEMNERVEKRQREQENLFTRAFEVASLHSDKQVHTFSNLVLGDERQYHSFWTRFDSSVLSSFMVYCGEKESGWRSHRPDSASRALNRKVDEFGGLLSELNELLFSLKKPLILELTESQWQMIDDTFSEKMEIIDELALPTELKKANHNAAIFTLKLSIIFSVIRWFYKDPDKITSQEFLVPEDDDVIASLWIADTCLKHAIRAYEQLPVESQTDAKGDRYYKFFNVLPPAFETSEAVELAGMMNIATRTAKRYLNTLIEEHKLKRVRKGVYQKVG
jgi:hypothetical protein